MIGRYQSGLVASMLALTLMACTGSPLAIKNGPDGRPSGTEGTPKIPSPSPFVELETPGQQDEPVLEPVGLNWAVKEISSPRDQQIQRIYGAARQAGGYKFFLQQGEHFYYRTASQAWSESQRLPSHRGYSPTRLFSDGEWLFFVNDPDEGQFSGEEKVYQAKEGGSWAPSTVPKGIVAVASGPGFAYAATKRHLYAWDGAQAKWSELPIVDLAQSKIGEEFIGLSVDTESLNRDLIVLMSSTNGIPYQLKRLPYGMSTYANLESTGVSFSFVGDRPLSVFRSFRFPSNTPSVEEYRYWGFSAGGRVYYGTTGSSLKPYAAQAELTKPFRGFIKQFGHFYAFRNDVNLGPQVYYLRDDNLDSYWKSVRSVRTDGSPLALTFSGENGLATDGTYLYAAGPEGLFKHLLLNNGEPETYLGTAGGWTREGVELNRAQVNQVFRCGTTMYAKTNFGTYVEQNGAWVPFELDKRPATIFSSIYGHVATLGNGTTVDAFYLFVDGSWQKVQGRFPTGAMPKAGKIFFSRDRLFVATQGQRGEAIYQRELKPDTLGKDWILAAPDQGLSTTYPTYISDGRVVIAVAVGGNKVRLASLTEQVWKDYPATQVLADGSTKQLRDDDVLFGVPFAVYGYAFVWVNMGGTEYRLCRATAKGWKPIVSQIHNGSKVGEVLSTDGHYLYSSILVGDNTREIVRVPIKDGTAWERVPATFNGVPLDQAGLKVNAPPFIDREAAKVYLPTSRGILGP